jgi:transcriptional regulator with XRE-family HTH domain
MIIQKRRLQRGWSQQQLSEVSGTSLRTIQRIEAGATPSLETLKALAAVFETSIEDLKGEPDMTAVENRSHANDPRVSPQEALAMRQVRQLRTFYVHVVVYLIVCTAAVAGVWAFSPENVAAAALLWVVWGAGVALHAAKTFLWGGEWERREVERRLGRPL